MEENREDLIAGFVCGIDSLVLAIISFFVCWWLGIIALVLGVITLGCCCKDKCKNRTLLFLGVFDIVVSLSSLLIMIVIFYK